MGCIHFWDVLPGCLGDLSQLMRTRTSRLGRAVQFLPAVAALWVATACAGPDEVDGPSSPATTAGKQTLAEAIVACLGDEGWEAIATADNAVQLAGSIPSEQMGAYQAAYQECLKNNQNLLPVENREYKTARYELQVQQKACLEAEGYSVSVAPTLQTYLDTYATEKEWFPTQAVDTTTLSASERQALFETCPPPEWE